jgi:hypothetical protein
MPASHFDVKPMTGRPKFIVRHSTYMIIEDSFVNNVRYAPINLQLGN